MAILIICRGLPGSGKTTYAEGLLAVWERGTLARVNRDDLRRCVFATGHLSDQQDFEDVVTAIQHGMMRAVLSRGVNVICDDTNLRTLYVDRLTDLARECNAGWSIHDMTRVPLEVCIERDAARPPERRVGAEKIRALWEKHIALTYDPLPVPEECQ